MLPRQVVSPLWGRQVWPHGAPLFNLWVGNPVHTPSLPTRDTCSLRVSPSSAQSGSEDSSCLRGKHFRALPAPGGKGMQSGGPECSRVSALTRVTAQAHAHATDQVPAPETQTSPRQSGRHEPQGHGACFAKLVLPLWPGLHGTLRGVPCCRGHCEERAGGGEAEGTGGLAAGLRASSDHQAEGAVTRESRGEPWGAVQMSPGAGSARTSGAQLPWGPPWVVRARLTQEQENCWGPLDLLLEGSSPSLTLSGLLGAAEQPRTPEEV